MNDWLKNLKVGDTVIASGRNFNRICTIDRLTKTQIVVGNLKYRISDGGLVGAGNWNYGSLHEPTEEFINNIKNTQKRNILINNIKNIDWYSYDNDKLDAVLKIVNNK